MADVKEIYAHPRHPYTKLLFEAAPGGGRQPEKLPESNRCAPGLPDDAGGPGVETPGAAAGGTDGVRSEGALTSGRTENLCGCAFYPRCKYRTPRCQNQTPERVNVSTDEKSPHWVKCFAEAFGKR